MHIQRRKIDIDKWLEGCRIGEDPGLEFVFNWIHGNAEDFRSSWEQSLCAKCLFSRNCGHEVRRQCTEYQEHR